MSLSELQSMFLATCVGGEPTDSRLESLRFPAARMRLYREMVRGRLVEMIETAFPRSAAAIGHDAFVDAACAFIEAAPPSSPYIRDVPIAFRQWMARSEHFGLAAELRDLLAWESAIWFACSAPSPALDSVEFSFDLPPLFNPTVRVLSLAHPVHRLEKLCEAPLGTSLTVAVYRSLEDHEVRWHELDGILAPIVFRASAETSVTARLREIAHEASIEMDVAFAERVATVMSSWLDRGLVLGSVPTDPRDGV